ncbi:hypothetical protein FQR65_LT12150 [Abscondita terminalis]|nr:hypothetical protein FQR65_LT12150 [Abscondita terminalis]
MFLNILLLTTCIINNAVNAKLSDDVMDDWNQVVARYATECIEESGANPIVALSLFNDRLLHDEEHIQCFIKCLNEKYGMLSPDGEFHVDIWLNTIKHLTPEVANMCFNKYRQETDLCKRSYQLALCVAQENYVE